MFESTDDASLPLNEEKSDKSLTLKPISESIIFYNLTMDAYLRDPVTWDMGAVALDDRSGEPYYQLPENLTGECAHNKALFHRATGLLFVPVPSLVFDTAGKQLLYSADMKIAQPRPNLVYDGSTLAVYERALALVAIDDNANNWSLARMPISSTPFPEIRRVEAEELPPEFADKYNELLAKWRRQPKASKSPNGLRLKSGTPADGK